ncbi:MAG TPA: ACT domain-containing protein [Armatimonadota bacterium]|nr:ACT domain-containing protein [Armatimonadota bacterium]
MPAKGPYASQLTIMLENKPGELERLARTLEKAGANILGISVADGTDAAIVRIITDSITKANQALKKAGMSPTRQKVLVVEIPNEPGALGDLAAKLTAADININYVYCSVSPTAAEGVAVLGVDDPEKALEAL